MKANITPSQSSYSFKSSAITCLLLQYVIVRINHPFTKHSEVMRTYYQMGSLVAFIYSFFFFNIDSLAYEIEAFLAPVITEECLNLTIVLNFV